MAALDATVMANLQTRNVQTDNQPGGKGYIRMVEASTPNCRIITPEIEAKLKTAGGNLPTIPSLDETVITTTSTDSLTIASNLSVSGTISVTRVNIVAGYHYYPAALQADMNQISEVDYVSQKNYECGEAMAKALEANIITNLDANRTQVWTGTSATLTPGFTWDAGTDDLDVTIAGQTSQPFHTIRNLFKHNKQGDNLLSCWDSMGLNRIIQEYAANGLYNAENKQNPFNIPFQAFESFELGTPPAGSHAQGHVIKNGAIGMVPNYTYDYNQGTRTGDGYEFGVTSAALPELGHQVGYLHRFLAVDDATTALTATEKGYMNATARHEMQFIFRYFLLNEWSEDLTAKPGHVLRTQLLST